MKADVEKRLALVKRILIDSPEMAKWYGVEEGEFNAENVAEYENGGLGSTADAILVDGVFDGLITEDEAGGAFVSFE